MFFVLMAKERSPLTSMSPQFISVGNSFIVSIVLVLTTT